MRNLLDLIYDYQLLRTKEQKLSIELDGDERAQLLGLSRMLGERTPSATSRRAMPRVPVPLPSQFTLPGGFESGEIKNLSGGGMLIATPRPPMPGTRVVVRIAEPTGGREFFFPCRVVWRVSGPRGRMGVVFDGIPTRDAFLQETTGVWRRSMRLGDQRVVPMVA